METMLKPERHQLQRELEKWVSQFCEVKKDTLLCLKSKISQFKAGDAFIGYHDDIIPSILLSQVVCSFD